MENNNILNDIQKKQEWVKNNFIHLDNFFPKIKTKAIFLNQKKIFTDISNKIKDIFLDIRKPKKIKIFKIKDRRFDDVFKKNKSFFLKTLIYLKNKKLHSNPINLCENSNSHINNIIKINKNNEENNKILNLNKLNDIWKISEFFIQKNNKYIIKSWLLWMKTWFILVLIILSFVMFWIWVKNYIYNSIFKEYQNLYNIKEFSDIKNLQTQLLKTKNKFNLISIIFAPINFFWNNIFYKNEYIKLWNNIIKWWKLLSEIALIWLDMYWDLEKISLNTCTEKNNNYLCKYKNIKITDFIKSQEWNIIKIQNKLKLAIFNYQEIKSLNNESLDLKLQNNINNLIKVQNYLTFFLQNKNIIYAILWDLKPQKYLVLNQNKDEIRANWWFPWSVITIDLYKWNIVNYDKKDVYYYDWHIYPYKETPPEWLNIISPNHWLRDANYDPSLLESTKKINFFYEKGWWWSLSTVISITQKVIEDFLWKYWPIHMNEVNIDITKNNFSVVMSLLVENKFNAKISPKDILFSFTNKLEKHLIEKKDFLWYLDIIIENLKKWEIVIASRETEIQNFIESFNIFDQWKKDNWNWIYPVFTSISWNKSDRYMYRNFEITTTNSWCEIYNSFVLNSIHWFWETQKNEINNLFQKIKINDEKEQERLMNIQWLWENRQFVRILVPTWSKLIKTYKNNIKENSTNINYTIFQFYLNTWVGKNSNIKFDYKSQNLNCDKKMNFYRQTWLDKYTFFQK